MRGLIKSRSDTLTEVLKLNIAQSAAVDVDRLANNLSEINLAVFNEKDYKSKVGSHSASEFAASGARLFLG